MNVVLFDIDGTLVLTGGAGVAAMREAVLAIVGQQRALPEIGLHGRTDRAIVEDLLRHCGVPATDENWRRFLEEYEARLPAALSARRGRALPGVAELIEELGRRERVHVGLLTGNVRIGAELKLTHYGLWPNFAFGGFGDERLLRDDVARDAMAAWRRHAGHAGAPTQVWVIGDTPADVTCARAIGARAIAVATGSYGLDQLAAEKPDVLLADLTDTAWLAEIDRV